MPSVILRTGPITLRCTRSSYGPSPGVVKASRVLIRSTSAVDYSAANLNRSDNPIAVPVDNTALNIAFTAVAAVVAVASIAVTVPIADAAQGKASS